MNKLQQHIENDVRQYARSVLCVGRERDSPGFAYTIGNWLAKLPELLIIGTTRGDILNDLSQKMIERGRSFDDGELVSLGGKFPVKIITADWRAKCDYTIQAGQYLGIENYLVQQVLISDRSGRFPDDPECQHPYSTIPVLKKH
jgi:hypothetical protein